MIGIGIEVAYWATGGTTALLVREKHLHDGNGIETGHGRDHWWWWGHAVVVVVLLQKLLGPGHLLDVRRRYSFESAEGVAIIVAAAEIPFAVLHHKGRHRGFFEALVSTKSFLVVRERLELCRKRHVIGPFASSTAARSQELLLVEMLLLLLLEHELEEGVFPGRRRKRGRRSSRREAFHLLDTFDTFSFLYMLESLELLFSQQLFDAAGHAARTAAAARETREAGGRKETGWSRTRETRAPQQRGNPVGIVEIRRGQPSERRRCRGSHSPEKGIRRPECRCGSRGGGVLLEMAMIAIVIVDHQPGPFLHLRQFDTRHGFFRFDPLPHLRQ